MMTEGSLNCNEWPFLRLIEINTFVISILEAKA